MPTNINMDNVQLLNTVRQYAPFDYQNRIPAVTQGSIESALKGFRSYTPDWDTFFGVFLQKIGLQVIRKAQFTDPFSPFKMQPMRLGSKIEEIAINLQRAHAYKNNCYDVFNADLPDTRVNYHSLNRADVYQVQAPLREIMQQAFTSDYSLSQYLGSLVDNLIVSEQADEYLLFKKLMAEYEDNEGYYNFNISVNPATNPAEFSRALVRGIRSMYRTVKFPSNKWSAEGRAAGLTTVGGDMVLIIDAATEAMVDVESLAAAFHLDKGDFLADNVVVIDEWPRELAGTYALMVDRDFFVVSDLFRTMQPAPINPCNLSQSFFYHVQSVISYSRFVPALRWSTDASTSIGNTPATVTGITIAMDTNARVGYVSGAGTQASPAIFTAPGSVRLIATGAGTQGTDTGYDLSSVEWSIVTYNGAGERYAIAPSDTHIDRNGILTIGATAASDGLSIVVGAHGTIDGAPQALFYVSVEPE
ncbi:MAG: hypothetical protein IKJ09_11865 [Bacteroidaceae bacterium]|nr:hypothetical protein [Bacteroidaceae bacterium]